MERKLLILFGSQTGTAEDVAERIGRGAWRRHFRARVMPMDEIDVAQMVDEKFVLFVAATTGQGDEPDNMKRFWKFLLKRSLPNDLLEHLYIGVLGLGDSSYQKYNFVGKRLYRRLLQLGASELVPLGLGDDQHDLGVDAAVDPWCLQVWDKLSTLCPLPPNMEVISSSEIPPPKYHVSLLEHSIAVPLSHPRVWKKEANTVPSRSLPYMAQLVSNECLTTTGHFQDVRLISFDIASSGMKHRAGDVLMIQPQNSVEAVDEFIEVLGLQPETSFLIEQTKEDVPIPTSIPNPCTVKWVAAHYFDIQSVPRRSFFEFLAHFATSEMEKEKLIEFTTAEGQEELYSYCNRPRRKITEVLADFPNATSQLPFEYIFDLIPPLQPRAFSIASSMVGHPGQVQILMAVVEYKTKLAKTRKGVCSTWLSSLDPKSAISIPVWITSGTLTLDKSLHQPAIMIGPGTGCAPFRAAIEERIAVGNKATIMLFGCRSKFADYFFGREWEPLVKEQKLILYTAFSRDQDFKVYVQHKIEEHGCHIWNWISKEKAYIYIAGNAKRMPEDVLDSLKDIGIKHGGLPSEESEKIFKTLELHKRLQLETWA